MIVGAVLVVCGLVLWPGSVTVGVVVGVAGVLTMTGAAVLFRWAGRPG